MRVFVDGGQEGNRVGSSREIQASILIGSMWVRHDPLSLSLYLSLSTIEYMKGRNKKIIGE